MKTLEIIENFYPPFESEPEKVLVGLLKDKNLVVSVAESFTGGNISAKITSVSGASSVFYEGIVAYNENSKSARLGVENKTLSEFKPVSYQVASQMAQGLLAGGNARIGLSTTGIAGPNSDDSKFPVGLCFIGVCLGDRTFVYKYNFSGDRAEIVQKGVQTALNLLIFKLKNI